MILSIGVIAYNEQKYLPALLEDIRRQTYPHENIEVVLIDSMSSDQTRRIMEDFKANNDFHAVQVLSNPDKIQAAGWNVAIRAFKGDALARIDAHARLTPEFATYVMEHINRQKEFVVGGIRPCIAKHDTPWGHVLLQIENSLFGSGINRSRRELIKTDVKTMFHATYRREVFEKVGLFNEKLLRTEDNEMHYRIRQAGYKLCYDPKIRSYQYIRSDFKAMVTQKWKNGYWIGRTAKICPQCLSPYHFVPAVFVIGIVVTTLLLPIYWPLSALLWLSYGLFAFTNTLSAIFKDRFYVQSLLMPFLFPILHISYGLGTITGFVSRQ
mgnify:CR=1 FL=1